MLRLFRYQEVGTSSAAACRFDDVVVAGTATQVAFQTLADLLLGGIGFSFSRSTAAMIMPGVQ